MNHKTISLTFGKTWHTIRSRPLLWDTVKTTLFSTVGKRVGFLIPFFLAAWFGVSSETNAFFFSYGFVVFQALVFFSSTQKRHFITQAVPLLHHYSQYA